MLYLGVTRRLNEDALEKFQLRKGFTGLTMNRVLWAHTRRISQVVVKVCQEFNQRLHVEEFV
jgi:hypothetical protein